MDNNINEELPAPQTRALLPDCMREEYKVMLAKVTGDKGEFSYTWIYPKSGRSDRTALQESFPDHVKALQLPAYVKWNDKHGLEEVLLPAILNSLRKLG